MPVRWALVASALAALLLPFARTARAEPPQMKEGAVKPRIVAESADGRYSVALGGFLQARYTWLVFEEAHPAAEFGIPRTRLYSFGRVFSRSVRYRLMIGTPPYSRQVQLWDAYVEWEAAPELRLRVGRFKLPVFREWVESARELASVDRSFPIRELAPGRDYGLMASGELGGQHVEYMIGAFNGAGDLAVRDDNASPAMAARVLWNVTGRSIEGEVDFKGSDTALVVGASGLVTSRIGAPSDTPSERRDLLAGAEVALRRRGLDVSTEVVAHQRTVGDHVATEIGAYARAHQYVPALKVAGGVRAARLVPLDGEAPPRTEVELDAAYFPAEHDLKVSVELGAAQARRAPWAPFFMAQAQVAF